jgi:hypothetical protein
VSSVYHRNLQTGLQRLTQEPQKKLHSKTGYPFQEFV